MCPRLLGATYSVMQTFRATLNITCEAGNIHRHQTSPCAGPCLTLSALLDTDPKCRCDSGLPFIITNDIGAPKCTEPTSDVRDDLVYGRCLDLILLSASDVSANARLHSGQVVET